MKIVGILLIIVGIIGVVLGCAMYGDIGIAALIGAATALISGFGFLSINKKLKN